MKLGMIGGKTSTIGFAALGVDTFPVMKPSEASVVWESIDHKEYAVIFMTEPIYRELAERVKAMMLDFVPTVIVIPAVTGSEGIAEQELRALVEKAVGTDMISGG
jgi:V/A-type H+/Na+-transporting ATPase subunit F